MEQSQKENSSEKDLGVDLASLVAQMVKNSPVMQETRV